MTELISYKGKVLSLGTCENLWHVSYKKLFKAYTSGLLKHLSEANLSPQQYLAPDSAFRFRFPFVDEKHLPLDADYDFRKTVAVKINDDAGNHQTVFISQQRCVTREDGRGAQLATLYRDSGGIYITEIGNLQDAEDFTRQIVLNHIINEPDTDKQKFYRDLVTEILYGYQLSISFLPDESTSNSSVNKPALIGTMKELRTRRGFRSVKNGHLGVYTLCSGPDPSLPLPGERLIIVIYDQNDNIVRRLEQVQGDCIDEGYVDFFNSLKCRPARFAYHIIDIDLNGEKQILATHYTPGEANSWLKDNVPLWAQKYGIPQ